MAESANNLQKVLDSQASDEVLKRVTLKKEILGAKKLFEATAQVPSPLKDFTQIVITERGIVWRKWKISLRGVSQGAVPQPSEEVMLHEDFQYDSTLQVCVQFLCCLQTPLGQLYRFCYSCRVATCISHVSGELDLICTLMLCFKHWIDGNAWT